MTSINDKIESTLTSLEENLIKTIIVNELYQKELIFNVIKEKHREKHITRHRRINAIKSPFSTTIKAIKGVLSGSRKDEITDTIDTSILEEDFKRTWEIIDTLEYTQLLNYYHKTMKHGLKRTNKQWTKIK